MVKKSEDQQPVQPSYAPQPDPNAQYGPEPKPGAGYTEQPVNQQYFAQPQAAPVQYVVMAESLKGLKGWLMFFVIIFVLQAIGGISIFFTSMLDLSSASSIVSLILSPFVVAASITAVVLISMGKKIGKWMAIGAVCTSTVYGIVSNIVSFAISDSKYDDYYGSGSSSVPMLISGILISILVAVLVSLYFINSRRVKETLIN